MYFSGTVFNGRGARARAGPQAFSCVFWSPTTQPANSRPNFPHFLRLFSRAFPGRKKFAPPYFFHSLVCVRHFFLNKKAGRFNEKRKKNRHLRRAKRKYRNKPQQWEKITSPHFLRDFYFYFFVLHHFVFRVFPFNFGGKRSFFRLPFERQWNYWEGHVESTRSGLLSMMTDRQRDRRRGEWQLTNRETEK